VAFFAIAGRSLGPKSAAGRRLGWVVGAVQDTPDIGREIYNQDLQCNTIRAI